MLDDNVEYLGVLFDYEKVQTKRRVLALERPVLRAAKVLLDIKGTWIFPHIITIFSDQQELCAKEGKDLHK